MHDLGIPQSLSVLSTAFTGHDFSGGIWSVTVLGRIPALSIAMMGEVRYSSTV